MLVVMWDLKFLYETNSGVKTSKNEQNIKEKTNKPHKIQNNTLASNHGQTGTLELKNEKIL